jgi:hypothetical protein
MSNYESKLDVHWLIKVAQEIRNSSTLSMTAEPSFIDPDLAHPALSVLCELVDRCGCDIEPAYLEGYAYGLQQAGLIDDAVFAAVGAHIGANCDNDQAPDFVNQH